jgi:hypothetical protein
MRQSDDYENKYAWEQLTENFPNVVLYYIPKYSLEYNPSEHVGS